MNDNALSIRGLGKKYHIGAGQERYRTLRDHITHALGTPFRRAKKLLRGQATGAAELDEVIWALKDVSFDVSAGEVVGVIGPNGAGKSTLLKILSRITEPTEGYARIQGRVGSLLEVGTGFHQELTGRENIYLNGAILGMKKAEIEAKFDEIVDFAGIAKFIDTPVKHYSSGMYVRLAFAVAAHLEPEILVVDEVLSVGDAAFQKKCLGKMGQVAHSGRTVLFVSHNMSAITELSQRVILLRNGRVQSDGDPAEVVGEYLSMGIERSGVWTRSEELSGSEVHDVEIQRVRVLSADGSESPVVPFGRPFQIAIEYRVRSPIRNLVIVCGVRNDLGAHLWTSWDTDTTDWGGQVREPGVYTSICRVPAHQLRPGRYSLSVAAHVPDVRLFEDFEEIVSFDVSPVGYRFNTNRQGLVTPSLEWVVTRHAERWLTQSG